MRFRLSERAKTSSNFSRATYFPTKMRQAKTVNKIMKNLTGKFTAISAALFLLLGFSVLADSANAQTRKRTKKKTTSTVPRPVTQTTVPVVVSQADQYS